MEKHTKESVKEFGRVLLLSVIPVFVLYLESPDMQLKAFGMALALASLRALDKFMHEYGKRKRNKSLSKGLTRF